MNTLATIVQQFETDLRQRYRLLPGHQRALDAFKRCRNDLSPSLQLHCSQCENRHFVPHSCGHRSCPHCQHFETEQWIQRQCQRTVPAPHYLLTFTLPKQLRTLAFNHQRIVYDALMQCAFQTIAQFTKGDPKLNGKPGAIAVLHTHSRQLHFHPHVHLIVPAAAVDTKRNLWRTKDNYLFNQRALAKVFRAKCFKRWKQAHLNWPKHAPNKWLVHCKSIGDAKPAIVYLGRYLYRGVLPERDIIKCQNGQVTFRYRHAKSKQWRTRTLPGAQFLWLLLQHVLPKGFHRSRNFGFLHPNAKTNLVALKLHSAPALIANKPPPKRPTFLCRHCGANMRVIATRLFNKRPTPNTAPSG